MEFSVGDLAFHYKGGVYKIVGIALHTETEERLVIYHPFKSPTILWARPYDMFNGMVATKNGMVKRFSKD